MGTFMVAHLAFRQEHNDRTTIADGVQLGVQPTLGSHYTTGNIPFLRGSPPRGGLEVYRVDHDALRFQPYP